MAPWLSQLIITTIIQRIKEKRMFNKVLKGKLTYSALGTLFAAIVTQVLGDGVVTAADWKELGEGALVLLSIFGRWRATQG